MTHSVTVSFVIFFSVQLVSVALESSQSCPVWLYYSNTTHQCQCGFLNEWIQCNQQEMSVRIRSGFCVTYSKKEGLYYGASCPLRYQVNNTNRLFSDLCVSPDMLESAMCSPYNRRGFQCGQCIEGYGPGVYTVRMKCVECNNQSVASAFLLYICVQFVPIIFLLFCIMVFRLNCLSGPMMGYVLFCQGVDFSIKYDGVIIDYLNSHLSASFRIPFKLSLIIGEFWTLAPLKSVIPPFCITDDITELHIVVLQCLPAFLVFLFVIASLVMIHVYSKNYRIISSICKPFSNVIKRTGITGDSAIRAFATFLFLSSTTSMYALCTLIKSTNVYLNTDRSVYKKVLYMDPSIEIFSNAHILLFLLVFFECTFFVFIPSLIIFIYPTSFYRRLSQLLSARKQLAITAFVEALNSPFKNGLNGTRDFRALAGILIFWTPILAVPMRLLAILSNSEELAGCLICILLSLLTSYLQPCKSKIANISLSFYLALFGILQMIIFLWYWDLSTSTEVLSFY